MIFHGHILFIVEHYMLTHIMKHLFADAVCCCLVDKSYLTLLQPHGARQAPLSMGFSRPEYWSGLSFPPP